MDYLTRHKVETRPLMNGNILNHEPFQKVESITLDNGNFPVGDKIERDGLFIPCWGMPNNERDDYHGILKEFLMSQ